MERDRGHRDPDQPARRRQPAPLPDHGLRPDAGEGRLPVAAADLHGRGDGGLDRAGHPGPLPEAQDRAGRGRARLAAVLPGAARHNEA